MSGKRFSTSEAASPWPHCATGTSFKTALDDSVSTYGLLVTQDERLAPIYGVPAGLKAM